MVVEGGLDERMVGWISFFRSGDGRKVEERREKEKIEGVSIFFGYISVTELSISPWLLYDMPSLQRGLGNTK